MSRLIRILSGVSLLIVSKPCVAQAPPITSTLTQQLDSPNWAERSEAFVKLGQTPSTWVSPTMAAALLRLLQREDKFIASTLRASNGKVGVSDKYGEGFSEYYAELFDTCLRYCDKQGLLSQLLVGARNGSPVQGTAIDMLGIVRNRGFSDRQRSSIDSALIASASYGGSFMVRLSGLSAINEALNARSPIDIASRQRMHEVVVAAVSDKNVGVRETAVGVLGAFRDSADLTLLRMLSERDTTTSINHGKVQYPIRAQAMKAIQKIQRP